jgi:hypothetical protein
VSFSASFLLGFSIFIHANAPSPGGIEEHGGGYSLKIHLKSSFLLFYVNGGEKARLFFLLEVGREN